MSQLEQKEKPINADTPMLLEYFSTFDLIKSFPPRFKTDRKSSIYKKFLPNSEKDCFSKLTIARYLNNRTTKITNISDIVNYAKQNVIISEDIYHYKQKVWFTCQIRVGQFLCCCVNRV